MSKPTLSSIDQALDTYRQGGMVIIVDDEDRENEGDVVLAADFATPEAINFMVTHARGLVCLAMRGALLDRLQIPMMVPQAQNRSGFGTGFTLSVEAVHGVSTGISAEDRSHTIRTLINPNTTPNEIAMPGHIFPLRARDGGVLERRGQTEASVDLSALAGLTPAGIICEVMREDGTMMRLEELCEFAQKHDLPVISVEQLAHYRLASGQGNMAMPVASAGARASANTNPDASTSTSTSTSTSANANANAKTTSAAIKSGSTVDNAALKDSTAAGLSVNASATVEESLIFEVGRSHLPTCRGNFEMVVFRDQQGLEHSALIKQRDGTDFINNTPLVRLHSECLTGDAFGSQRCDCGAQLHTAMERVEDSGNGAILYLRQEGRGIGLGNKIRAYALQDTGLDTVDANHQLGFPADARTYDVAAAMLRSLGIRKVNLLSNNPVKQQALKSLNIEVVKREALIVGEHANNEAYLRTKAEKMGHQYFDDSLRETS